MKDHPMPGSACHKVSQVLKELFYLSERLNTDFCVKQDVVSLVLLLTSACVGKIHKNIIQAAHGLERIRFCRQYASSKWQLNCLKAKIKKVALIINSY